MVSFLRYKCLFFYTRLNPNEIVNAKRINMKAVSFIFLKKTFKVNISVDYY